MQNGRDETSRKRMVFLDMIVRQGTRVVPMVKDGFLIFYLTSIMKQLMCITIRRLWELNLPGEYNGIQPMPKEYPVNQGSKLRSSHEAPASGYLSHLSMSKFRKDES